MESAEQVRIVVGDAVLDGDLAVPPNARGVVLFAHGSGSSRHSPRNRYVAEELRRGGIGTLLMDLLTPQEEEVDNRTAELRFDLPLLAQRLQIATECLHRREDLSKFDLGYFGASTGAAAALIAAVKLPKLVRAIVSRGGRPDLAGEALAQVQTPTLLIVGGNDGPVVGMNRDAFDRLTTEKQLEIIPGATHLFEEPGALEQVAQLARSWFARYLGTARDSRVA
ncbi:MAG: dienelactone hydrolase family protein [Terriglobales bacterium]